MEEAGYMLYADTFINSLFVDRRRWFPADTPVNTP